MRRSICSFKMNTIERNDTTCFTQSEVASISKFQVSDSILSSHIRVRNTYFYNLSLSYKLYWMRKTMITPWLSTCDYQPRFIAKMEFLCVRNVSKKMWSHSMISSISQKAHYKKVVDNRWSMIYDPQSLIHGRDSHSGNA